MSVVFVNKMDLDGADKTFVMNSLEGRLGSGFVDFCRMKSEVAENCALFDENIMNEFLETGSMSDKILSDDVAHRKVFPCFFGSALKLSGVEELLDGIKEYEEEKNYSNNGGDYDGSGAFSLLTIKCQARGKIRYCKG